MSAPVAPRLHRRAIANVIDGAFGSLSRVGRLHPNSNPVRHGVEHLRDVPYLDPADPIHHLDVWRPDDMEPGELLPAVLYAHGGAFQSLSKSTHWLMALAYARRGYVVFNVDYRLAPQHPFPAALQDVCAAALWVKEHAAEYGGDVDRMVFAGDSAGANLVTSLTVCSSWRRPEPWAAEVFEADLNPRVVAASYGVFQVSDSARFRRRRRLPWFVHQRIEDVEDCYLHGAPDDRTLADPLLLMESDAAPDRPLPPFFLPVGTSDPLLDDTRRMAFALEQRGIRHEARYYPKEVHGFDALIWRKNARTCWGHRFAFLDDVLGGV